MAKKQPARKAPALFDTLLSNLEAARNLPLWQRGLSAEQLEAFEAFRARYRAGDFAGYTLRGLHRVVTETLGITMGRDHFIALIKKAPDA